MGRDGGGGGQWRVSDGAKMSPEDNRITGQNQN